MRKRLKEPGSVSPGIVAHIAGPTETGWRVIDVWESEEAFRRFSEEMLLPAFKHRGVMEAKPHIFPVYNFVRFQGP
jgi:hypothetical protein